MLPTSCLADGLTDLFLFFVLSKPEKGKLHESFSNLKTESNRLLTMWMNGKKIAVEEIDVLEEKPPPLTTRRRTRRPQIRGRRLRGTSEREGGVRSAQVTCSRGVGVEGREGDS